MPDTWTLITPDGEYQLNPTFSAPQHEPGASAGPGLTRHPNTFALQRVGDGLRTPGPFVLTGRVWRDNHDATLILAELETIREAAAACTAITRTTTAGTYTYEGVSGGPTPEITPDGLGGANVRLLFWPALAIPTYVPTPSVDRECMQPAGGQQQALSASLGIALNGEGRRLHWVAFEMVDLLVPAYLQIWRKTDATLQRQTPAVISSEGRYEYHLEEPFHLVDGTTYVLLVRAAPGAVSVGRFSHMYTQPQKISGLYIEQTRYETPRNAPADRMPTAVGNLTPIVCLGLEQ